MIVKDFNIDDANLKYFVGINQINFDLKQLLDLNKVKNENEALDFIFNLIEKLQNFYKDSVVQFFSDNYILNQNQIFMACYYVQKAYIYNFNISKKKNIELFLYLAANRQIKIGIKYFGINISNLKMGKISYCVISPENNLDKINKEILENLNAKELGFTLNDKSVEKYNKIKDLFGISNNQIKVILNSYGINKFSNNQIAENLDYLFLALEDLIYEKMSLLSLENIKMK
ncbi:MAG: KEOPS complex subunit Cgi121 [Promethearchaeota archaeon]